jgi:hypothetical protein
MYFIGLFVFRGRRTKERSLEELVCGGGERRR